MPGLPRLREVLHDVRRIWAGGSGGDERAKMRTPTPLDVSLAWYRNALANGRRAWAGAGGNEEPECGWFEKRGQPFSAARIWLAQEIDEETGELMADEVLRCEVNGRSRDPDREWQWLCGNPISEAEFHYRMASQRWAAWYAPNDPAANPAAPIDWFTSPVRF